MQFHKAMLLVLLMLTLALSAGLSGCAGADGKDGKNGADGNDGSYVDDDSTDDDVADDDVDDDTTDDDTTDDDTTDDDTTDDDTTDDDTTDDDTTDDDTTDDDTTDDDTTDDDTADDDTGDDDTGSPYEFGGDTEIFGVEIADVVAASTTTVYFAIADADGNPVTNMASSAVRFGLAQLTDSNSTSSGQWVSYIYRTEVKDPGEPGTEPDGTTTYQATSETCNNALGLFTNYGDGTYSYKFSFDITAVTTPVAVTYDPTLVHRIAMQYTGNTDNAILDFVPNGDPVGETREIFLMASCNTCHTKLAMHGGGRIAGEYCVVCHNPGTQDANSGNVLDMATMTHKIHRGADLANGYTIWGNSNSEHDYSDVVWPQDVRNCDKCHSGAQGENYHLYPRKSACGACHDAVDFSDHFGDQSGTDENCVTCHNPGYMDIEESHEIPMDSWTPRFQFNILEVTNTAPGQTPVVKFSVTDPTNADAPYDIKTGPIWTTASCSSVNMKIANPTTDYTNTINPTSIPAQPVSVNALTTSVANGDGTYTITFTGKAIPGDATGSGVVFIDGRPCGDLDGDTVYSDRIVVRSVEKFFAITDTTIKERRNVVAIEYCDACHDLLSLHGGNRNDNTDVCLACHNPRATDILQRPASVDTTPADGVWDNPNAVGIDGKRQESINFKYMVHAIHAGDMRQEEYVVYGYGRNPISFGEVVFPGDLATCTMCHLPNTYGLPLASTNLATTLDQGTAAGPGDDEFMQAAASACFACHDDDTTLAHLTQMGGIDGPETCTLCHGVGKDYDVYEMHN